MSALTSARRSTSARLAGIEIPAAFELATVNAALNAQERRNVTAKDRRRLLEKAELIAGRAGR